MGKVKLFEELREQAQELIDLGDSREKAEGYGMMKVIDALSEPKRLDGDVLIPVDTGIKDALGNVIMIGSRLDTVGHLREIMSDLDDHDQICIEAIDLETGDVQDLYPMYVDVIENVRLTDDTIVREVRFCQMPNTQQEGEADDSYFKVVHRGWCKASQREEIQIHAGQHGNILLYQDGDKLGFIVDVYGENDIVDTLTVWEEDLNPEEESGAPENFSDLEVNEFKNEWGQDHTEICANLGYDTEGSDELLMEDYFWLPDADQWYPKSSSMYSERQQAIADFLKV